MAWCGQKDAVLRGVVCRSTAPPHTASPRLISTFFKRTGYLPAAAHSWYPNPPSSLHRGSACGESVLPVHRQRPGSMFTLNLETSTLRNLDSTPQPDLQTLREDKCPDSFWEEGAGLPTSGPSLCWRGPGGVRASHSPTVRPVSSLFRKEPDQITASSRCLAFFLELIFQLIA